MTTHMTLMKPGKQQKYHRTHDNIGLVVPSVGIGVDKFCIFGGNQVVGVSLDLQRSDTDEVVI